MRRIIIILLIPLILCLTVSGAGGLTVSAEAAVLLDASDGTVLFARGAGQRMQPASMTKIMTALVALENCRLDDVIKIKSSCTGIEGSSAYLQAGEVFTVEELLYALLLQSANDAAAALADHIGGFVGLMNEKAAALGLDGTHFTNPHGLTDKDHYSTAYDIARLLCECMKNADFRRICGEKEYVIKPGENRRGRYFKNHNRLLFTLDGVCGGKTGYTSSSGRCLCSYYEKDGVSLCAVTMNAPRDWEDHGNLYEYGVSLYRDVLLDAGGEYRLHVVGGVTDSAVCTVPEDVTVKLRDGEVTKTVYMRRFEYAPVYAGERIGELVFTQNGRIIYKKTLYADNKTEKVKWKR